GTHDAGTHERGTRDARHVAAGPAGPAVPDVEAGLEAARATDGGAERAELERGQAETTSGRIIGRRRSLPPSQRPTTRRTTCRSWKLSVLPWSTACASADSICGRIPSKTSSPSAMPRAWISGPASTLPVAEST